MKVGPPALTVAGLRVVIAGGLIGNWVAADNVAPGTRTVILAVPADPIKFELIKAVNCVGPT